jgi:hypothetical protein
MREVLSRLKDAGWLDDGGETEIKKVLAPIDATPVYVRALVAIGAWFSALAFTGFVFGMFHDQGKGLIIMLGLSYCAGATLLRRVARHAFFRQVALAFVLAGYYVTVFAAQDAVGYANQWMVACLVALILAAVLHWVYEDQTQRFVTAVSAGVIVSINLFYQGSHSVARAPWLLYALVLTEVAAVVWLFSSARLRARFKPLAYAVAVTMVYTLLLMVAERRWPFFFWRWDESALGDWVMKGWMTVVLAWLVRREACEMDPKLAQGRAWLKREDLQIALGAILLLGAVSTPGVLAGLLMMALGRAAAERFLEVGGGLLLAFFVFHYYYALDVGLLEKSAILLGSGLVLLAARWLVGRRIHRGGAEGAGKTA